LSADDAPLIFEVAEAGDQVAKNVLRWAGLELAGLVNGVIRQLEFQNEAFEVVLVGSMFKGGPLLLDPMRVAVYSVAQDARFVHLDVPPVVGGVLLGMECAGVDGYAVRDNLVETTKGLLENLPQDAVGMP
jgi:N-acetylglucosamine kinase-like BadF-type ATPase